MIWWAEQNPNDWAGHQYMDKLRVLKSCISIMKWNKGYFRNMIAMKQNFLGRSCILMK